MEKKQSNWNELAFYITENIRELKKENSDIQDDIKLFAISIGKLQVWALIFKTFLFCVISGGVGIFLRWFYIELGLGGG